MAVVWIYGAKRLASNVKDMTGKYPNIFFRFCWVILSPLLILVRFSILQFEVVSQKSRLILGNFFSLYGNQQSRLFIKITSQRFAIANHFLNVLTLFIRKYSSC